MRLLAAAAATLLSAACVHVTETGAVAPGPAPAATACRIGDPMVETMLYMGMLRPGGSISRFEFQQFVEKEVAPRWKEGFTILEGQGLWLSEQRNITEREPTHVLVRLHDGSAEASAQVDDIRAAYIKAFEQDAVLRTDRQTCASF
jgi:hypothetical protein